MQGAAVEFLAFLADFDFNAPRIPVLHNVDASAESDPEAIKSKIARQLHHPVLWVKTINTLAEGGIERVIEVGPGKVLAGLNRRINKELQTKMIFDLTTLEELKNG